MKYTITINQAGIVDSGYADKTDLSDWIIIDYIKDLCSSPHSILRYGKALVNYQELMIQIPILGINSKSAVSKRIRNLATLGLIETYQHDDGRIFAEVSDAAIDAMQAVSMEVAP